APRAFACASPRQVRAIERERAASGARKSSRGERGVAHRARSDSARGGAFYARWDRRRRDERAQAEPCIFDGSARGPRSARGRAGEERFWQDRSARFRDPKAKRRGAREARERLRERLFGERSEPQRRRGTGRERRDERHAARARSAPRRASLLQTLPRRSEPDRRRAGGGRGARMTGLLEIFDPKAPPRAIGIDLGTTNSLVAYVKNDRPTAIRDCDQAALL